MCGIVGFVGKNIKVDYFIDGLKKLEYRGYDSSGVSYDDNGKFCTIKKEGRIKDLEKELGDIVNKNVNVGLAHTRWATHGGVSDENSHPHTNEDNKISVVHNGIIENFQELRKELISRGHVFRSSTDTEVIPHLIEECYRGNLLEAVIEAIKKLEGAYAIGVIHSEEPDKIVAARKGSPLVVAGNEELSIIASDVTPILKYSKEVNFINDGEIVELFGNNYKIFDLSGNPIERKPIHIDWDEELAEKGGYEHFMQKEIFEQPVSIKSAISGRIKNGQPCVKEIENIKSFIENDLKKIYVVACGTSYHAGLAFKYFMQNHSDINVEIEVASEFRYCNPNVNKNTLVIAVSQSGETIDTLEGVRLAKNKGAYVLAMSNVVGSTIPRESDSVVYMNTGPEIGVAATKTYTAQIAVLYSIGSQIMKWKNQYSTETEKIIKDIENLPEIYKKVLDNEDHIIELAREYVNYKHMMYIGRGTGYTAALEGALKLKEISYIHASGYQAGELKHGPIALLDESFPVFAIVPFNGLREKMISNIMEVKARKARIIAIVTENDEKVIEIANEVIKVPETSEDLLPLTVAPVTQLFSYHIAVLRGLDPDKPRNLAKSVTVE